VSTGLGSRTSLSLSVLLGFSAPSGPSHTSFPNGSTADQFFDEAQWESYRRLGEYAGVILFAPGEGSEGWTPHRMVAGTGTVGVAPASPRP